MKEKTTYIANDGTEFETKEECEYYENRYKVLLDNPEIIFFNKNLEPLAKCDITDDGAWRNLFLESCYINIPSVECFNQLAEVYEEFVDMWFTSYAPTDNSKIGLWRYDNLEEYWENLNDIKVRTDKIIEQANEIVLKEKESYGKKENI